MKRIILSLLIVCAGTAVFCASRQITAGMDRDLTDRRTALSAQRELLKQTEAEQLELADQSRKLKLQLGGSGEEPISTAAETEPSVPEDDWRLPLESEQLLAALGFSWNRSPDFVVVSKHTLTNISLTAIQDRKLTAAACEVLAITPEERVKVEGLVAQVSAQYDSWVLTHYQRDEPGSNVVAKYELPQDPEFSCGLSNQYVGGVTGILGAERGRLLANYSLSWMSDVGMQPEMSRTLAGPLDIGPLALTVTLEATNRTPSYTDHSYMFDLHQGQMVNLSRWYVTPKQDLPARFHPLFPNGWPDLARREGFELPHAFSAAPHAP
jgi:hypothetical protein